MSQVSPGAGSVRVWGDSGLGRDACHLAKRQAPRLHPVGRARGLLLLLILLPLAPLASCGGDGPLPPPPPPPPPPPGPPPPGATLAMELGDVEVLTTLSEVRSFKLEAASGPREYILAVHSAAETEQSFNLRLRARGPDAPGVGTTVVPDRALSPRIRSGPLPPELASDLAHMRLRQNMRRELEWVRPRPARRGATGSGAGRGTPPARFSVSARSVPQVGDSLDFKFAVQANLTVSCTASSKIRSVVRAVGDRFVMVEDTTIKDGFGQQDWDELNVLLDGITFPVDSAYFGPPADIDGNDRAIILFTSKVNALTPKGSNSFIGGLFWPGDLAEATPITQGGCPSSNEAEIVYLQAPDPNGTFSDAVTIERARRNARSVTAHEFQHLLDAEQRVFECPSFGCLEDVWLSEGLAHIAEEVVGFKVSGLGTRQNLGIDEAAFASEERFNEFRIHHFSNYFRLAFHFNAPHTTPAFGESGQDPGGDPTLQMRGNAWIFLRWLADRHAPAVPEGIVDGSGEELLFQELSSGGPSQLTGIPNVLRALSEVSGQTFAWADLLAEYEAALAVDDVGPPALPEGTQVSTWNLRSMFEGIFTGTTAGGREPFTSEYPLQTTLVAMGANTDQTTSFELNSFTARYFLLTSSGLPAPDLVVEVTNSVGTDPPAFAALQVTVVRVQ